MRKEKKIQPPKWCLHFISPDEVNYTSFDILVKLTHNGS